MITNRLQLYKGVNDYFIDYFSFMSWNRRGQKYSWQLCSDTKSSV